MSIKNRIFHLAERGLPLTIDGKKRFTNLLKGFKEMIILKKVHQIGRKEDEQVKTGIMALQLGTKTCH